MGPRTGLDALEKRRISCRRLQSNYVFLGPPAGILTTIQATLFPHVTDKIQLLLYYCYGHHHHYHRRHYHHHRHVFELLETIFRAIDSAELLRKTMRYVLQHVAYNTALRIETSNKKDNRYTLQ
jgi:hypothetical protein